MSFPRAPNTTILLDLTLRVYDDESGAVSDSYGSTSEVDEDEVILITAATTDPHVTSRARLRTRHTTGSRALFIDDTVHLLESVDIAKRLFQSKYLFFKASSADPAEREMELFLRPHKNSLKLLLGTASSYVHDLDDNRFWETRIKKAKTEEEMLDLFTLIGKNFR